MEPRKSRAPLWPPRRLVRLADPRPQAAQRHPDGIGRVYGRTDLFTEDTPLSKSRSWPYQQPHRAYRRQTDAQPEARSTRNSSSSAIRRAHVAKGPDRHTRAQMASLAASVMHTGNAQERRVAASVLCDHKTRGDKK